MRCLAGNLRFMPLLLLHHYIFVCLQNTDFWISVSMCLAYVTVRFCNRFLSFSTLCLKHPARGGAHGCTRFSHRREPLLFPSQRWRELQAPALAGTALALAPGGVNASFIPVPLTPCISQAGPFSRESSLLVPQTAVQKRSNLLPEDFRSARSYLHRKRLRFFENSWVT